MSKRKRPHPGSVRDAPQKRSGGAFLVSNDGWQVLCGSGYKPITSCPEVQTCIGIYADLIGSMTLRLMRNSESGDVRVRNGLSRKLDIDPSKNMTRLTFIQNLVRVMLSTGNQVTFPVYRDGFLEDLVPLQPSGVSFSADGDSYTVRYRDQVFRPDEVLHFPYNPDPEKPWFGRGLQMSLRDAVDSLRQADATRGSLLKSPAPSVIVKVDGLTEEFSSKDGRKKLREQYLDSSEAGEPWFIPAEAFSVEQVKPLTLSDLAIKDSLELDKKAIAAAFGVPAFLVGVGTYNQDEYRHFLNTRVMTVAKLIEQELTKKLLYAQNMYFKFNMMSLYSYSMTELVTAGATMVDHMTLRRNEWRDWLGLSPDPEMDELLSLENYIPADRLGDQKKLKGGEDDGKDAEPKPETGESDDGELSDA